MSKTGGIGKVRKENGKIQTVMGLIDSKDLGVTLMHEHFIADFRNWFIKPDNTSEFELAYQPFDFKNLSWVRHHRFSNLDNLTLTDEQLTIDEARRFRSSGGSTIVDVTPINVGRDPIALTRIAQSTGLNVIMGTAYYVESSYHPEMQMDKKSEKDIAEDFARDILVGSDSTGVRAGIIGEIGCSWPLTKNERKVLRAAAIAQQRTGAPISIHPGANEYAPFEIIEVLNDAGADLSQTIICHIDKTISDHENRCKLAETKCYLEYDQFGTDGLYPPSLRIYDLPYAFDVPYDLGRINQIIRLINDGYLDQILMSGDIWTKTQLSYFGSGGYAHITSNIVPLMRIKGISSDKIQKIIEENPKRVLSFI